MYGFSYCRQVVDHAGGRFAVSGEDNLNLGICFQEATYFFRINSLTVLTANGLHLGSVRVGDFHEPLSEDSRD